MNLKRKQSEQTTVARRQIAEARRGQRTMTDRRDQRCHKIRLKMSLRAKVASL